MSEVGEVVALRLTSSAAPTLMNSDLRRMSCTIECMASATWSLWKRSVLSDNRLDGVSVNEHCNLYTYTPFFAALHLKTTTHYKLFSKYR